MRCTWEVLAWVEFTTVRPIWFCPNVDAVGVLDLFREPWAYQWLWTLLRDSGGGWKFYTVHVEPGWHSTQRPPPLVPYESLVKVDAFRKLKELGVPIGIEAPAIKSWDKDGEKCRDNARLYVDSVRAAGGDTPIFFLDEPWTWSTGGIHVPGDPYYFNADGTPNYDGVALRVSTFFRELRDYGVQEIHWTEASPNNPPMFFVEQCKRLMKYDAHPDGFLWDWNGLDYRSDIPKASAAMRSLGVSTVGAIVCPYSKGNSQADFAKAMRTHNTRVLTAKSALNSIHCQSWHCRTNEQEGTVVLTLPAVTPEKDKTSHLAILKDVSKLWHS